MSETDTLPAGAEAEGATSIDSILGSRRHQTQGEHEAHREVGAAPQDTQVPPEAQPQPSAQPAPTAETPAPAGQAEMDFEKLAEDPKFKEYVNQRMPKWAREAIKEANRKAQRTDAAPAPQPAPAHVQPPRELTPEELGRPLTVAEMLAFQDRFAQQQQAFATQTKIQNSEYWARQKHGELFDEAYAWLDTQPDLQDHFIRQPDPWGAAVAHYQRVKLAEEIGDDPRAWQESQREKIRQELLMELNAAPAAPEQHVPAMRPQNPRPTPPQPASTVRSAQPRDDTGRFTGPTPVSSILPNKF